MTNNYVEMTRETFKNYCNLGGIDYIGRGPDQLRTSDEQRRAAEVCRDLKLTGLVLVGATDALTDGVNLA